MFALLVALVLVGLAFVAIPVWLIMPFKPQPAWAVSVGYTLDRFAPLVTLAALVAVLVLLVRGWRAGWNWPRRIASVAAVLVTGTLAWFARQNHFEWMFAPLPDPGFARPAEAEWVAPAEPVLAVTVNGEAVAFPIRQVAYHHLVQDSIGGVPIVATY